MKPLDPNAEYDRWAKAVYSLTAKGFRNVGGWIFEKNGIKYDLSAADLDKTEIIEKKGLFVIN